VFHSVAIVLFVFSCFIFTPALSGAGEPLSFALFARGWTPFEMMDEGEPYGLAVDLFYEVLPDDLEKKVVPMTGPRKSLHAMTKPMFTRLEAQKWMPKSYGYWWSEPVISLTNVLYSSVVKPRKFTDQSSLSGLTIGCIRNYFYPVAQPLFDNGKAVRYDVNSDVVLLRMVKAGRVDAAIFDAISAKWLIKNTPDLNSDDFYVAATPVDSVDLRFVFNLVPEWEKRLPEINERIRQKREDGTIDKLESKYR